MDPKRIHDFLAKAYLEALQQSEQSKEGKPLQAACNLGLDAQQEQAFADFFNHYVRKEISDSARLQANALLSAISKYLAEHGTN